MTPYHVLSDKLVILYLSVSLPPRSAAMMVFVPVQHKTKTTYGGDVDEDVGKAGFLVTAFLQSAATLALFLAIDHERQYRSSGKEFLSMLDHRGVPIGGWEGGGGCLLSLNDCL